MEDKLKELASQKYYKDQLLKGFRQVTINRLTEVYTITQCLQKLIIMHTTHGIIISIHIYMQPYACAVQQGAKCLLDDLDSKPIKLPDFHKVLLQV